MEVLLDVVYNHTLEADDKDPYLVSFRGIENKTYYMTDTTQYTQLINWSGCGNTVNGELSVSLRGQEESVLYESRGVYTLFTFLILLIILSSFRPMICSQQPSGHSAHHRLPGPLGH